MYKENLKTLTALPNGVGFRSALGRLGQQFGFNHVLSSSLANIFSKEVLFSFNARYHVNQTYVLKVLGINMSSMIGLRYT